ncbi:tripartite tricarboxylate transporter family receptor [Variibacter gotjawalensis]|uniref:Tripartite tricarboxylate transporter family receptor n=1 Tax=Variibacter gotjawalensis TaxID=1333996 RepID=A0A0S3PRF9_9BRAD|nr:tripartite tricarboxylate transporter substrate binding protein [Variibacter gotjawalensis]NIK48703.1 tripartite-type tricarboxylate transporter receptor subunit TctC [Variibacter gotjawalensis]RZS50564.1 tripartite-type tricarboxylate transporter receptor subunit TctC [Variibacter gotjawalensis]BAT58398.1 tripartite tricarboxylate transporter family receptor [Variibacter gotjawalensis]
MPVSHRNHPSRRTVLAGSLAAPLLAIGARGVFAQEKYPSRTVRFVVPFPPGSGTDTMARLFAKVLQEQTGQSFIVENRAGGNGFVGAQAAIQAPPDGYTVFVGANSTLSVNAVQFKKLPYDPVADFSLISLVFLNPCLVIVPANSPYKTLADLVADAKKRPGALNYGSGSATYQLYSEWLNEVAGMKTTPIPFKGAGDATTATVAGQVDFSVVDASSGSELIKSGNLRGLVFANEKRSTVVPDVPTSKEAGVADFLASVWVAIAMPAKVPQAITDQFEAMVQKAGQSQDVKDYMTRLGSISPMLKPDATKKFQQDEIARFKQIAAKAGIEQQ